MRDIFGFFAFIFFILIGLLTLWYGLRSYGQGRAVSTYQTPLVAELINNSTERSFPVGPRFNHHNSEMLYAEIEHKKDGGWNLKGEKSLSSLIHLAKFKKLLLFVQWDSPKALPELRSLLKKNEVGKEIIFCSRSDGILKDIRDLEPEWTYCNGEVFLARFLSFASIGLESLLKIPSDVFIIHMKNLKLDPDFETLVAEAKRQNKFVLIGPVARPMKGLSPHAWFVYP